MMAQCTLADPVSCRDVSRRGGLSGLDLPPLHAPQYNTLFLLCGEEDV